MNPLAFPSRVILPGSRPDVASSGAGGSGGGSRGQSFADALSDVAGVARDMAAEKVSIANQMRRVVASGDNSQMPQVMARILDANARQDVMATVLTKTTTGVDQIVKMQ